MTTGSTNPLLATLERPHHGDASQVYATVLPGSGYLFTSKSQLVYHTRLPLRQRRAPWFDPFHGGVVYTTLFAVYIIVLVLFVRLMFADIMALTGMSTRDGAHLGYVAAITAGVMVFYATAIDRGLMRNDSPVYING